METYKELKEYLIQKGFKRLSVDKDDLIFRSKNIDVFLTEVNTSKREGLPDKTIAIKYFDNIKKEEGKLHTYNYDHASELIDGIIDIYNNPYHHYINARKDKAFGED